MQFRQWRRSEVPEPFRDLLRQRQELRRTRKELINQLYETIAELEGRPVRRPEIGFPFNLVVRFVYKALGTVEALVRRTVSAIIK